MAPSWKPGRVSLNQRGMPLVFSGDLRLRFSSFGRRTAPTPFRCFTREVSDQPDTLRRAAAQWRGGPTARLMGLRIAHNDLQHGNVLVQREGGIRLVDYDGKFLPKFRGERSPELGHKNYQHPERSPEHYDENVDNFSSLVIYLSLLATHLISDFLDHHGTGFYGHAIPHTVRNINDRQRQWRMTKDRRNRISSGTFREIRPRGGRPSTQRGGRRPESPGQLLRFVPSHAGCRESRRMS